MRPLRILEIITVPFFAPRGTSFSSLERTRAFARLGHQTEILAYSLGEDVEIPNARIHRIPALPGIREIAMGPSLKKLVLDAFLAFKTAWWLWRRGPWDLVHVHEEAAYWVAFLRFLYRGPVLYDMHSSLVEQIDNFGFRAGPLKRLAVALFARGERRALDRADAVIVVYPELARQVERLAPGTPVAVIENLPVGWDLPAPTAEEIDAARSELGLGKDYRIALYTGTFGKNQGLETALDALALLRGERPGLRLALVGGGGEDLARVERHAASLALGDAVILTGRRPPADMPRLMALADVLLSPRLAGVNTPLKIYAYLAAGRPILATDLPTHTQVLDDTTALLVEPTATALAAGIERLLDDPERARQLAENGRRRALERYGVERYDAALAALLEELF